MLADTVALFQDGWTGCKPDYTDKLLYLAEAGIEPIILSGVSGEHDKKFMRFQFVPWGSAELRFDMRHVIASHRG